MRSVSPNQEAALAGVRVVAHLDVWIATLRPRVSSAELFLVQRDKLPSAPGGNEALGYRILRKSKRWVGLDCFCFSFQFLFIYSVSRECHFQPNFELD